MVAGDARRVPYRIERFIQHQRMTTCEIEDDGRITSKFSCILRRKHVRYETRDATRPTAFPRLDLKRLKL